MQEDPIALYIIVRESLGMDLGKAAAQAGHAVENVLDLYRELMIQSVVSFYNPKVDPLSKEQVEQLALFENYRKNGRRKITLVANEKEWEALKQEFGKRTNIVVDAGITDLEPGTETMMAFYPQYKSSRSKSLKRLRPCK